MMGNQALSVEKVFGDLRADFRAAKQTRFTSKLRGVNASGSGADYHYRSERDFLWMIERARAFVRDDMVVGQGVRRLVSNVVRSGFIPDPKTGDRELDRILKAEHEAWASDPDLCHSEGELTFPQIERLALEHAIVDGDVFHLLRNDGRLQAVEGHRPRTPTNTRKNVVHGILLDDNAQRKEVWISKESLSPNATIRRVSDIQAYPIRDDSGFRQVLQVYFPRRYSQRRGITALAPITDCVGMHDDLQFSTLVKAQLASLIVIFRKQNKDSLPGSGGPALGTTALNASGSSGDAEQEQTEFGPIPGVKTGLDVRLAPGEDASGFSPNIPNPEFFPHTSLLLTFIAVNLDMPVHMLLLDPTKTNFSGWRGAIDQARIRFQEIQTDLTGQFHQPVWKWRVRNLIRSSAAIRRMANQAGVTPLRCVWKLPSWPYLEPLKDAQADDLQVTRFLNSQRRIQSARGREWPDVANEIVEDKSLLIRKAISEAMEINAEYPDAGVTWREILGPGLTMESPVIPAEPSNPDQ